MKFKRFGAIMLALLLVNAIGLIGCGDDDEPVDTLVVNRDVIDPNNPIYSIGGNIAIRLEGAQHIAATFIVSNGRVVGGSWAPKADPSKGGVFCNQTLQSVQQIAQQYSNACGFAYGLAEGYVLVQAPYAEERSGFGTVTKVKYLELFGKLADSSGRILRKPLPSTYVNRFNITKTKFDLVLPALGGLNGASIKSEDDGIDGFFQFQADPFE